MFTSPKLMEPDQIERAISVTSEGRDSGQASPMGCRSCPVAVAALRPGRNLL
jgi:hypothetical protein